MVPELDDDRGKLDRLLHHAHVAMISGDSFGLRERHKAGISLPGSSPGVSTQRATQFCFRVGGTLAIGAKPAPIVS
jgi:hypothetical protein